MFTVSLGTADGRLIDGTPVPPDPDELRALAEATGAKAYLSRDAESVSEVYSHLGAFIAPSGCAARRRRGLWAPAWCCCCSPARARGCWPRVA